MIAIGGAIGTGLFVGSGSALATGGPGALFVDFVIIGLMLYNVCMTLAELCVDIPVSGSFTIHSSRFLDPAWAFAMGWNYALHELIVLPLELTAAGIVINYWTTSVNISVWIVIFLIAFVIINLFGVRGYGEIEFFMSLIKVIAVIGFIILAIVLILGGDPNHQYLGAKYWHDPGSSGNSAVYGASRTLCALAEIGQAPKIVTYIDRKGRPLPAVVLSMLIGLIAYINCANLGKQVFEWLLAISGL
jgi:amino acid transporter